VAGRTTAAIPLFGMCSWILGFLFTYMGIALAYVWMGAAWWRNWLIEKEIWHD